MAGYSGTPLAKKLGIKEGSRVYLLNAPSGFERSLGPAANGASFVTRIDRETDIVHLFETRRARLEKALAAALAKIRHDAVIWVSWPKRASKMETDITEDVVREVALPMGLVDIKVCAVDDVWSGLKLMVRKELR